MNALPKLDRPFDDEATWQTHLDEMHRPDPGYGNPWGDLAPKEQSALARLETDGIVVVPDLFPTPVIGALRHEFEALIPQLKEADAATAEAKQWECRWQDDAYVATNQAIRDLPAYLTIATWPGLLRIAAAYLQRPVMIRRTQAIHQGLTEKNDYGSFQWHHDQCGPQFKMILLLTEVKPGGQHTQVARGTHRMRYPFPRWSEWSSKLHAKSSGQPKGLGSRYTDQEIDQILGGDSDGIISGVGPAGSAILFDSNALHRGRRGLSTIRNTAVFMFSPLPGLKVTEVQIHGSDLDKLDPATQRVFTANPLLCRI